MASSAIFREFSQSSASCSAVRPEVVAAAGGGAGTAGVRVTRTLRGRRGIAIHSSREGGSGEEERGREGGKDGAEWRGSGEGEEKKGRRKDQWRDEEAMERMDEVTATAMEMAVAMEREGGRMERSTDDNQKGSNQIIRSNNQSIVNDKKEGRKGKQQKTRKAVNQKAVDPFFPLRGMDWVAGMGRTAGVVSRIE